MSPKNLLGIDSTFNHLKRALKGHLYWAKAEAKIFFDRFYFFFIAFASNYFAQFE